MKKIAAYGRRKKTNRMNGKAPSKEVVAGKRSEFETEFASSEECDEKPKTASWGGGARASTDDHDKTKISTRGREHYRRH